MSRSSAATLALALAACLDPVPAGGPDASAEPDGCTPRCTNRQCGSDGCGGTCGTCASGTACDEATGTCECVPDCAGKACGPDGCGAQCGACAAGNACSGSGQCVACTPGAECAGKSCGTDNAGCSCGVCGAGTTCNSAGQCVASPRPDAGAPDGGPRPDAGARPDGGPKPDGGPAGRDAGPVVPGSASDYESWVTDSANKICAYYLRCGAMAAAQSTACLQYLTKVLDLATPSVAAGTRDFDKATAASCLTLVDAAACDTPAATQCGAYLFAAAAKGEECLDEADCMAGLTCVGPACSQTCETHEGWLKPGDSCNTTTKRCDETLGSCHFSGLSTGVCTAYLPDGQLCPAGTGAVCNQRTSFCDSRAGKCAPKLDVGGACESVYSSNCREGLYCKRTGTGDAGVTYSCQAREPFGAACSTDLRCEVGLTCDKDSGKCLASNPDLGAPCSTSSTCQTGYCAGASGATLGTCAMPTIAGPNAACTPSNPKSIVCQPAYFCDAASSTCKARLGDGQGPCSHGGDCLMFVACVTPSGSVTGTCQAQVLAGESCAAKPCMFPLTSCDSTTKICKGPQPDGATCTFAWDCQSETCFHFQCVAACAP